MEHATSLPFASWESFYVIVGSSAAALIGLQFVVIVLGAEVNALSSSAMRAFGTPTIAHFCATLSVSAILSAPWHTVHGAAVCLLLVSVTGAVFLARAFNHARKQTAYRPVFEDWLWHFALPAFSYLTLLVASMILWHRFSALFVIGASALALLLIGIHNAWDSVTYIALDRAKGTEEQDGPKQVDVGLAD